MAGQVWGTNNLGGYMSSKNLSKFLRHQVQPMVRFRQMCDTKEALGKNKGDKFHWNVYNDTAALGAALVEGNAMPETNFTITQGEITVTEYGISVPYTGKLETMSEHDVKEIISKVLKNNAAKTLDGAAYAQFEAALLRVAPTGGTSTNSVTLSTNGSTAITNNVALGKDHVKAIVDIMKERNIPEYDNGAYVAVGRPTSFRQLKNDLEALHQYVDSGFQMILNGEIGKYEGVRFVEQTNINSEAWTNAKSDGVFFCGGDTVTEAVSVPEEMRAKIPTDFGRAKGIAWYYVGGFGITHTDAANSRIVKWDSAA